MTGLSGSGTNSIETLEGQSIADFIGGVMYRTILLGAVMLIMGYSAVLAQGLISQPESVSFDTLNNRYLVSNVNGADIIQIDTDFVTQSYYQTDLGQYCASNHIVNGVFYVSVFPSYVKGYNLTTNELVADLQLPATASLDGMTADSSGNLYVVDTQYRKMLKIKLSDYSISTLVSGLKVSPQDITFDAENNRILVCYYHPNAPVDAVSLPGGALSTVVTTTIGYFDGITRDGNGNTYLSSHNEGGNIYRYGPTFTNPPELISTLPYGPAGLDYNKRDNILAVPDYNDHIVYFLSFNDADADGTLDYCDNCPNDYNAGQENSDGDSHGDACDLCPGFNDDVDGDADGVPDGCDMCPGFDDKTDVDEDGYPDECDNCPDEYNPGQEDANSNGTGDVCDWICGDANGDASSNILDVSYIVNYLYRGGPVPDPPEKADVNHSGGTNILDVTYLINYLYKGGPAPNCP